MITLIVAMDENGLIGANGKLPWHIPEDLTLFKMMTVGKTVIMGRKTHESIGGLLPNRDNVILSRSTKTIECAVKEHPEAFIIGGGEIYKEALDKNLVHRLMISHISGKHEGDTYFPKYNKKNYELKFTEHHKNFKFCIYERVQNAANNSSCNHNTNIRLKHPWRAYNVFKRQN